MKFTRFFEWEVRDAGGRDLVLFGLFLLLSLGGLLILYPASSVVAYRELGDSDYYLKRQAVWLAVGLAALFFFALVRMDFLRKISLPGILLSFLVLLLVFIPGIGHSVSSKRENFHRWIDTGFFTFQPSEFAKIAVILYLASVFSKGGQLRSEFDLRRLALPMTLILANLTAIVLEPQYGTTICILSVIFLVIYISGFPMIRLFLVSLAALPLLYLMVVLWDYRLDRFKVWLNPYEYRLAGGYQLVTAFRAFRDGGFFGEDLTLGRAHSYLTYGHTDFILALFAEDFGWIGVTALFLLYGSVMVKAYYMLRKVQEPFVFLVGTGCLVMIILQTILNIFVVTGIVPTTGVSLPFISYGGSSLIVSMSLAGIIINCSAYSRCGESQGAFA